VTRTRNFGVLTDILQALASPISIPPILIPLDVDEAAAAVGELVMDIICDIDVEDALGIDIDMSILDIELTVKYSWQKTST
jgi:hypothetical protein